MKKSILAAFLLLSTAAQAMPHDQPLLHFFSNGDLSVGVVFSPGSNSSPEAKNHRRLEHVYVCKDGKQIIDTSSLHAVVDSDGVLIRASGKSGKSVSIEMSNSDVTILASTIPGLSDDSEATSLKETISGINGFEVDWSTPCAPKAIDE